MVQVDVFWAYGIGASFALAASHQITGRAGARAGRRGRRRRSDVLADPYLAGTVLYCATVFAPGGVWLLWSFPDWETMQVGGDALPAWLVAAFVATCTTQGAAGYLVTRTLISAGRVRWAALQVALGYYAMFLILVHGWDGEGYRRVLSVDREDYRTWESRSVPDNVVQWATSGIALTLAAIGAVLVTLMLAMMHHWHREGLREAGVPGPRPATALAVALGAVVVAVPGAAIATSLLIHLGTAVTGSTALGWVLGAACAAPLLWLAAIRPGAAVSTVIRWLALPPDTGDAPPARPAPAARAAHRGGKEREGE